VYDPRLMDQSSLIGRVLYWSSSLAAEQELFYYMVCIDPLLSDFYWPPSSGASLRVSSGGSRAGSSWRGFRVGLLVYLCFILRYGWGYVDL
jgi:hypothetical protein